MAKPKETPMINLDAVIDIFGRPAGWMLYWGNITIFFLFTVLLGLAAWISYPDEIELKVQISTPNPPAQLVTSINGVISDVFIEEGTDVVNDQNILLLDNPAKRKDIEQLKQKLTQIQALEQATDILNIELDDQLDVGELGAAYVELLNHTTTLKYWLERSQQGKKARRLTVQLAQKQEQDEHLLEQFNQLQQEVSIAERNAQQYADLLTKGAASQLEVDQAASRLLHAQRQLKVQENLIIQNHIQTESLEFEKIGLGEQLSDQISEQWLALKHQQRKLQQALRSWEDRFLIKAKAKGMVTYFQPLTNGQYLEAGQLLGNIVPSDIDELSFIAEGKLSGQAIGKIKSGQAVFIALDAYPYREFGKLKGRVAQLGLAPNTGGNHQEIGYRILIDLPQRLKSTYGKELVFKQQLKGLATIITEDRSFLDRILDRFRDLRQS